ncbi:MAG: kinase/pyrophosphorylase [Coriobacteriales bacterium]|jgi:regulator of PEP synthase PpsR (kinase-PPPase family)|nr:kinase/pyrophosphorylase [Coriobacteriales bacterium]
MSEVPTINIVSDSLGDSASTIAVAAASQFTDGNCIIERLPNATSFEQIETFINHLLQQSKGEEIVLFYTIVTPDLRNKLKDFVKGKNIAAVDLIGPAIEAIAEATGMRPRGKAGLIHRTDSGYYNRVEAMEFAVDHDDGRNPEELDKADIVLIGASRTSKTPLSIFLATQGYRVANVPLALGVQPPSQLFELAPFRIFGLTSKQDLLAEIRTRRLGDAIDVAGEYASPEYVQNDLDEARALMRRLGCIVVRTDNRAIEETASEILRYYHAAIPKHD